MAEVQCRTCSRTFDKRGSRVYCTTCLPPPSEVGIAEYRRRHRALQEPGSRYFVDRQVYQRIHYRAMRALAQKHPYEFMLLVSDMRAAEGDGPHGDEPA